MGVQPEQSKSFNIDEALRPCYPWSGCYRYEIKRLKTFEAWPLDWLDKNALATTGMFYTGRGDKTSCYFCGVIIGKWEAGDDPVGEHLRWSPRCPLLHRRTSNNVPINEATLNQLLLSIKRKPNDTPPIPKVITKTIADYSIKAERLQTFTDWPRSMKQRPEQLADAGFYYKGVGDSVICFSCLGGLKDWEEHDDPWEEHALWMGDYCPYVQFTKGKDFIESVKNKYKNMPPKIVLENSEKNQLKQWPASAPSVDVEEHKLCKICFDKECNAAYVPCGHIVACLQCSFEATECPLCRASVERVVRLYFA